MDAQEQTYSPCLLAFMNNIIQKDPEHQAHDCSSQNSQR